ncbi:MAG: hypothetical protein N3A58_03055 [Spirochaetes bacterium]|nr:hypothetical protein [Spirochaetota bacterium]
MEFDIIKNLFSKNKKLISKEQIISEIKKFLTKVKVAIEIDFNNIFNQLKKFSKIEVDEFENIFSLFEFDKKTSKKDLFAQLKNWAKLYFKIKLDDIKIKDEELSDELEDMFEKEGFSINKTIKYSLREWYKEKIYEKEKSININEIKNKLFSLSDYEILTLYFIIVCAKNPYEFLVKE